jgi:hypothetical protein
MRKGDIMRKYEKFIGLCILVLGVIVLVANTGCVETTSPIVEQQAVAYQEYEVTCYFSVMHDYQEDKVKQVTNIYAPAQSVDTIVFDMLNEGVDSLLNYWKLEDVETIYPCLCKRDTLDDSNIAYYYGDTTATFVE